MRLLIFLLLIFLVYQWWAFLTRSRQIRGRTPPPEKTRRGEDMVLDPQCGTYVPKGDAVTAAVRGDRLYFCSRACRDAYLERPRGNGQI